MTPLAAFALAACAAVAPGTDHVLLRDLAAAFPGAVLSAPDAPVGLAPAPGVERRFGIPELRRIAARFALPEPAGELCVTRPVAPLDADRIRRAMRERLPAAEIDLIDFSRWPVPEGALEFPLSGLREDIWSGGVIYAGGRRFPVWARVRVRVSVPAAVALRDLRAGERLDRAAFRSETRTAAMSSGLFPASAPEAAGKRLRRPVRAGSAIPAAWLETPPDVIRGDRVHVEVRSGAARVAFEGEAQGSGSAGQTIPVLNPETGRRFSARIEGPGRVEVAGVL